MKRPSSTVAGAGDPRCGWHNAQNRVELRDQSGRMVAFVFFERDWWRGHVMGRRDPEPAALSLNQMQAHLELVTGVVPELR